MKNETNKNEQSKDVEYYRNMYVYLPEFFFATSEIGVAAALMCLGYTLICVDAEHLEGFIFLFDNSDEEERHHKHEPSTHDLADRYFTDELDVKAKSFFNHLKVLNNRMSSNRTQRPYATYAE